MIIAWLLITQLLCVLCMLFFDDDINFNVKALIIKENMKIIGKGMQI